MSYLINILVMATLTAGILLTIPVLYLLLLTVAAIVAPQNGPQENRHPVHRFVLLVPAHNEERLLPQLLANLRQLDYPKHLYSVHVVADNCTDETVVQAHRAAVTVHERTDTAHQGKGYALQWLIDRLLAGKVAFDAAVILDADSIVSQNFLRVMDVKLSADTGAIQAHYAVHNPEGSWLMSLRALALAAVHYLRPRGRMVLGGSVGLKGNGMVFSRTLLEQHRWSASVTEDIEFHMSLVLAGERVVFAADAIVWAEMPADLRSARSQNVRWEQGRLDMVRRYVPILLRESWKGFFRQGANSPFLLLDAAVEHIIPPFSILTSMSLLLLVSAWALNLQSGIAQALLLLGGQLVYLITGSIMAGLPSKTYIALLCAPLFLIWKVWLYVRVLLRPDRQGWVRTARIGE